MAGGKLGRRFIQVWITGTYFLVNIEDPLIVQCWNMGIATTIKYVVYYIYRHLSTITLKSKSSYKTRNYWDNSKVEHLVMRLYSFKFLL